MLYAILSTDSLVEGQGNLRALLALAGTPTRVSYLSADRFAMRRASDGAIFDWQEQPTESGFIPSAGNYVLAESASVRGLGRVDLVDGETYTLEVDVQGTSITAAVTIPARPAPVLVVRPDGRRVLEWPRIPAAGRYDLDVPTDLPPNRTTTDTFYVLRDDIRSRDLPPDRQFRITAIDTNWSRYLGDSAMVSAGVRGAYGVFGASSSATMAIPR